MIPYAKQMTFLFFGPTWTYNHHTGEALERVGYNPLTDMCCIRKSKFGYVVDTFYMERTQFENLCNLQRKHND